MSYLYKGSAAEVEQVRKGWGWFLALGIGLTVLGIIATVYASTTTALAVIFFGWIVVIAGVFQVISAFQAGSVGGAIWRVLLGLLFLLAGGYLIAKPAIGALTATFVIAMFLVVEGLVRVVSSAVLRYDSWGWATLSGFITFGLGVLLLASWPVSGTLAIGLFIGIDLILGGITWIAVALAARRYLPPIISSEAA
jgi:uncharacterized membrane protein HdeD (DUF308 family)